MGHCRRTRRHHRSDGRGRTSRVTAAQRRRTAAKKTRERAAYRRHLQTRTLRKQRERQEMLQRLDRERMNRYLEATRNPYGMYGQKWDEASFDMYD